MTGRRARRGGLLAAAAIVLAACGSGDGAGDATPAAPDGGAAAGDEETATAGDGSSADTAAVFAQVFAGAQTIDGADFDGATLAGVDTVAWFWAPWCTICRAEGPEIAEVAQRFGDDVQIIGVPGRGELGPMGEFVADTGTGFLTHVVDSDGSVWSAFDVFGQPAFAFIDDSGETEVFVGSLGGDALAERVEQLITT